MTLPPKLKNLLNCYKSGLSMSRSEELFLQAQKTIPGGVNSPVRAFRAVGGTPVFF